MLANWRGSKSGAARGKVGQRHHERLRNQLVDVREPLRVAAGAAVDARVERMARDAEPAERQPRDVARACRRARPSGRPASGPALPSSWAACGFGLRRAAWASAFGRRLLVRRPCLLLPSSDRSAAAAVRAWCSSPPATDTPRCGRRSPRRLSGRPAPRSVNVAGGPSFIFSSGLAAGGWLVPVSALGVGVLRRDGLPVLGACRRRRRSRPPVRCSSQSTRRCDSACRCRAPRKGTAFSFHVDRCSPASVTPLRGAGRQVDVLVELRERVIAALLEPRRVHRLRQPRAGGAVVAEHRDVLALSGAAWPRGSRRSRPSRTAAGLRDR